MPVPSSFNEITQNNSLRDYIGWVWYDREAWVPASWRGGVKCVMLRFESAHYNSIAVRVCLYIYIMFIDGECMLTYRRVQWRKYLLPASKIFITEVHVVCVIVYMYGS